MSTSGSPVGHSVDVRLEGVQPVGHSVDVRLEGVQPSGRSLEIVLDRLDARSDGRDPPVDGLDPFLEGRFEALDAVRESLVGATAFVDLPAIGQQFGLEALPSLLDVREDGLGSPLLVEKLLERVGVRVERRHRRLETFEPDVGARRFLRGRRLVEIQRAP